MSEVGDRRLDLHNGYALCGSQFRGELATPFGPFESKGCKVLAGSEPDWPRAGRRWFV